MPGEINLEVVAEIAKAKAGLAELTASIKTMETQTGQTAKAAGNLDKQFESAGKKLIGIGKGGVILAGLGAIKTVVEWTKQWENSLADVGKRQRESQLGMLSLAQAMPKRLSARDAADVTSVLLRRGARAGLSDQDTEKLLSNTFGRMRGAGLADTLSAGEAAIDLVANGVAPEEAVKAARSGTRRQQLLQRSGERRAALLSSDPYLIQAEQGQVARTMAEYERRFPSTVYGRRTLHEGLSMERERALGERAALMAGYLPEEGKAFGALDAARQDVSMGLLRTRTPGSDSPIAPGYDAYLGRVRAEVASPRGIKVDVSYDKDPNAGTE